MNRPSRSRAAFTLLEILVALAIIGLLAGLAVNNADKILGRSQEAIAKAVVRDTFKSPLLSYKLAMGDYPSTAEGLQALLTAPSTHSDRWRGPYLDTPGAKLPTDPWEEPYVYRYPGTKNKGGYDLFSKGPDRIEGTEDDVGNW